MQELPPGTLGKHISAVQGGRLKQQGDSASQVSTLQEYV